MLCPSEFSNVWETAFDVTDPSFDCNVNRTHGTASSQMYLINHFLDTLILGNPAPDVGQANVTNGVSGTGSLGAQVDTCVAANGRAPNFMLVDVSISSINWLFLIRPSSMSMGVVPCFKLQPQSMESPIILLLPLPHLTQHLPLLQLRLEMQVCQ